jgi:hypothetical protein
VLSTLPPSDFNTEMLIVLIIISSIALSDGKHTGNLARHSNRWSESQSLSDLFVDQTEDLIKRDLIPGERIAKFA